MAKQRESDKRRKKMIKWGGITLLILIIISIGLYYYYKSDELEVLPDYTAPPHHKDFISYNLYENTQGNKQQFVFVSDASSNVVNYFGQFAYDYISSAGIQYYKGNDYSLLVGKACSQQQLIRFVYCDNAYDKSKCTTDIFKNLWLVNSYNDYPNFAEYSFTGDTNGFYYTYSCYEKDEYKAITNNDAIERRYLYDGKCISAQDSNWAKGQNFNTEKECLAELKRQLETEASTTTCTYKTYSDYVCKTNNLYQKERLTNCDTSYTKFVKRCDYGCENGACKPQPSTTCVYEEYQDFKCIGDVQYQKVQERDCSIGYTLPVGACGDTIVQPTTNTTTQPTTNTTIDLGGDTEPTIISCKGYESLSEDKECKFNLASVFSDRGMKDLWPDYKTGIIIGLIVLVIAILFMVGGKRK
jgi:hypothetical protein